jgi:hypothetical protein
LANRLVVIETATLAPFRLPRGHLAFYRSFHVEPTRAERDRCALEGMSADGESLFMKKYSTSKRQQHSSGASYAYTMLPCSHRLGGPLTQLPTPPQPNMSALDPPPGRCWCCYRSPLPLAPCPIPSPAHPSVASYAYTMLPFAAHSYPHHSCPLQRISPLFFRLTSGSWCLPLISHHQVCSPTC